jgi:AcrR family transcriptional regulator
MSPRPYRSPRRAVGARQTRARVVAAAAALLGAPKGIAGFSLEAVAKKARVTRLTVYNQFGSRRALLEAVFDERAARGGLHRIAEAMADADPHSALRRIIAIFCDFWSFDTAALSRLHAAGASDPEFATSVRERNERRRRLLSALVARMTAERGAHPKASSDLVDVLFALTSLAFFEQLAAGGRTTAAACQLIEGLARAAVNAPVADDVARHAGRTVLSPSGVAHHRKRRRQSDI